MASSSVPKIKNICVFCGSNPGKEKEFLESANHLGRVLAERKIHLVYGGGSLGLMGSVSIAAFLGGSQVLGVVPKALAEGDIIGKTVGEELQVSTMSERLSVMFNHADAFIALPARQILISAATAEQLIDELQSFIPVVDSSMSRLNWSITERRKKLRLDLSLSL
ncbi:hypothetical protein Peur_041937 [Populus x canadensis]